MSPSGLINFSDAKSLSPSASNAIRDIRNLIIEAFDDNDFFQGEIVKYLLEPGYAGNRQMDQAMVAQLLFERVPVLTDYTNLNHKKLWGHVSHVLDSYGFVMKAGRVDGHVLEHITEEAA